MKKRILMIILCCFLVISSSFAQWQQLNGPYGSYAEAGSNSFNVYACLSYGCYVSHTLGEDWHSMNDSIPSSGVLSVQGIAVSDSAFFLVSSSSLGRVIRTYDDGLTWENASSGLPANFQLSDFLVIGKDLLIGTDWGVFHSPDEGDNWIAASSGLADSWLIRFCFSDSVVYGISTEGRLSRTTDFGGDWDTVSSAWLPLYVHPSSLILVDSLFLAGTPSGIFSQSFGDTCWTQVTELQDTAVACLLKAGDTLFAGTSEGVFRSFDQGSHWIPFSTGLVFKAVNSLTRVDSLIFAGTNIGVYRTGTSVPQWSLVNEGLHHMTVTSMTRQDSILFAGTQKGVFRSEDDGAHWVLPDDLPSLHLVEVLAVKEPYLFAGTSDNSSGGFFRSSDYGSTWTLCINGLGNLDTRCMIIEDTVIYLGTENGIYFSGDDGSQWHELCTGFNVFSMEKKDSLFFIASYSSNEGFYRSTDNGHTWTLLDSGIPPEQLPVTIAIKDTLVFAGTIGYSGGLYRTSLNGNTWTTVVDGLASKEVRCLLVKDTAIYAGTYFGGMYVSTNNGDFWHDLNQGLPDPFIYDEWEIGEYLYVSNGGLNGIWKRAFDSTHVLKHAPDTLLFNWSPPSQDTLFIQATGSWGIQGSLPAWLGVDKLQGTGNDTILFSALTENLSEFPNQASLMLLSENLPVIGVTAIQLPKPASMSENGEMSVRLYPNPTTGRITIRSDDRMTRIRLINALGIPVFEQNPDAYDADLDLSGIEKGVYVLKVEGNEWSLSEKLILR